MRWTRALVCLAAASALPWTLARAQGTSSPPITSGPAAAVPPAAPTIAPTIAPTTAAAGSAFAAPATIGSTAGSVASATAPAADATGATAGGASKPATSSTTSPTTSPTTSSTSVYDLPRCLALADAQSAQVAMATDRLAQAHAQLDEVHWIPWSQFAVTGGIAAVPQIRGTSTYSPNSDISFSNNLGPAWRVTVEGVIPLWTFGKISAANAAADKLVEVAEGDVDRVRTLMHHDVRRAYFGLGLAHDARYLLKLASDKLDAAIAHAEDDEGADEGDVLKMKTYRAEIGARVGEVDKGERITVTALRFLTGIEAPLAFDIPDEPIHAPKKPLVDVMVYLDAAKSHRPELRMVRAGIEARAAQVDLAKARMYPDIGLGLSFGYANAPIIVDQTNPFIVDNANYLRYGLGVVFRWNLDLFPAAARVHYAEAQLQELRDTQSYASGGVEVEVQTAYAAAEDASTREKNYGEAESLARRWVATISAGIAIGTRDDKDLIDPLRYFLTDRYNHLQAIMDLDVAMSSLSLATGDDSFAEY